VDVSGWVAVASGTGIPRSGGAIYGTSLAPCDDLYWVSSQVRDPSRHLVGQKDTDVLNGTQDGSCG
jgi:hypothetical protein